jgi:type IV secretion/conjugal transfer VirB4 family ATPase
MIFKNLLFDLKRIVSLEAFVSKSYGVSDLLLPVFFCDDGIIVNKDGSFTRSYWYSGADLDSSTDEELDYMNSVIFSNAFTKLGDGWTMHLDLVRKAASGYIANALVNFPEPTTLMIDAERKYDYEHEGGYFENSFIVTFTYLPPVDHKTKVKNWFIEDKAGNLNIDYFEHLDVFKKTLREVLNLLSSRVYTTPLSNSETMSYFNLAINGIRFDFPKYKHGWIDLNYRLANQDVIKGFVPKIGDMKVAVVSVGEGLPLETVPALLHNLTTLGFEYRWSTRFIFLDKSTAKAHLDYTADYHYQSRESIKQTIGNKNRGDGIKRINRAADRFADQAEDALERLEAENVTYGKYTCAVVVFDKDEAGLDNKTEQIKKVLGESNFMAKREVANCFDAWLGAIPGMVRNNVRKLVMDTINLADIMPTTSVWSGYTKNPCRYYGDNSPPLFYASTEGGTPFRGCTFVGDIGHTLILGPSRSGKSVFLNFIAAQHFRYKGARGYHFDNGYSGLPLCYAMNGAHYDIGTHATLNFKPLDLLSTVEDFSFTVKWLTELAEINLLRKLTAEEKSDITQVLEIIRQQGTPEQKTINYFYMQLKARNKNPELAQAYVEYTTIGGRSTLKSTIFNASTDHLALSFYSVFELEKLMKAGDDVFIPTVRYLFYMISRSLDGSPTFIILEEAWSILRHKIMQDMLDEWLRAVAKKGVFIVVCSQQVNDILKSEIKDVLLDQCKTKIFLPNPTVITNEYTAGLYLQLGLNSKQISMIGNALPQRHYYFSNPIGNRLINLELNIVARVFLTKTSMEDIAHARAMKAKYKEHFGYYWLKVYNLDNAAEYWLETFNTLSGKVTHNA